MQPLTVVGEVSREPGLNPVRGTADGSEEAGRVREDLQEQDLVVEQGQPVMDEAPRERRQDVRARLRGASGGIRNREFFETRCRRENWRLRSQPIRQLRRWVAPRTVLPTGRSAPRQ